MSAPIADSSMQVYAGLASVGTGTAAITLELSTYWLGVPMPVVLASFAGSCCALSFLGSLDRFRAMTIVICCTLIGTYMQPLLGHVLGIPGAIWPALGFATGLGAHTLGTVLFGAAPGAVKDALTALIDRIRGRQL